jgi:hypothetical protein
MPTGLLFLIFLVVIFLPVAAFSKALPADTSTLNAPAGDVLFTLPSVSAPGMGDESSGLGMSFFSEGSLTGDPGTPRVEPGTYQADGSSTPSNILSGLASAPEPSSLVLLGSGSLSVAWLMQRRRNTGRQQRAIRPTCATSSAAAR